MKVRVIVKASKGSEVVELPNTEQLTAMGKDNEETRDSDARVKPFPQRGGPVGRARGQSRRRRWSLPSSRRTPAN